MWSPPAVIKEQGVTNLQDALKNVPGITLNAGEGGTHGDLVNLRGFSAGDDYFLDGLRDTGLYNRDVFDYESLEVLKGPASTLFGRGTTGGVINQVSKAPGLYPDRRFHSDRRHQRRSARHRRRQLCAGRHFGGAPEPDGPAQQCGGPQFRPHPEMGRGALLCLWHRHRH